MNKVKKLGDKVGHKAEELGDKVGRKAEELKDNVEHKVEKFVDNRVDEALKKQETLKAQKALEQENIKDQSFASEQDTAQEQDYSVTSAQADTFKQAILDHDTTTITDLTEKYGVDIFVAVGSDGASGYYNAWRYAAGDVAIISLIDKTTTDFFVQPIPTEEGPLQDAVVTKFFIVADSHRKGRDNAMEDIKTMELSNGEEAHLTDILPVEPALELHSTTQDTLGDAH